VTVRTTTVSGEKKISRVVSDKIIERIGQD